MSTLSHEELPTELEIALAYSPQTVRERLRAYFAFDQRLARIVGGTTEPMLGQMRLAWWRDMLAQPNDMRPKGDAVLEAIGALWHGNEAALQPTVDGWEGLITAETLGETHIAGIAKARAAAFQALVESEDDVLKQRIYVAAARYTSAEVAIRLSDDGERALCLAFGASIASSRTRLPKELRGLAVLERLSFRAIERGGRPIMEGRGAALTAVRAAIFR